MSRDIMRLRLAGNGRLRTELHREECEPTHDRRWRDRVTRFENEPCADDTPPVTFRPRNTQPLSCRCRCRERRDEWTWPIRYAPSPIACCRAATIDRPKQTLESRRLGRPDLELKVESDTRWGPSEALVLNVKYVDHHALAPPQLQMFGDAMNHDVIAILSAFHFHRPPVFNGENGRGGARSPRCCHFNIGAPAIVKHA